MLRFSDDAFSTTSHNSYGRVNGALMDKVQAVFRKYCQILRFGKFSETINEIVFFIIITQGFFGVSNGKYKENYKISNVGKGIGQYFPNTHVEYT